MIKKLLTFVLPAVVLMNLNCYAQSEYTDFSQLPTPSRQSISNQSGGNNVDVDLFTGIANVNIPIYNYSVDGLNLGVSLSYNTKGIMVDQIASPVGLGWDLNAGGYIQRTVNGIEDEVTIQSHDNMFIFDAARGFPSSNAATGTGLPEVRGRWVPTDLSALSEDQSDCFTAVFGGRVVKFASTDGYQFQTDPDNKIKISFSTFVGGASASFSNNIIGQNDYITFTITDEKGNQFYFIRGDYEIKNSVNNNTYYPTDKWVLSKITTASGHTINYIYNSYALTYYQYRSDTAREIQTTSNSVTSWSLGPKDTGLVQWQGYVSYISEIDYPNGIQVNFNNRNNYYRNDLTQSSSQIPVIDQIIISNSIDPNFNDNTTYQFDQAYFSTPIQNSDPLLQGIEVPLTISGSSDFNTYLTNDGLSQDAATQYMNMGLRLKLKDIYKLGNDGNSREPYYTFNYNATPLPFRCSYQQDWFGYYNNATSIQADGMNFSIPIHNQLGTNNTNLVAYGINKDPNYSCLPACILTSMTNALGGETDINYLTTPNILSDALTAPSDPQYLAQGIYDGLCIDHIDYKDAYNAANNTTVQYQFTNGVRFFPGAYYSYPVSFFQSPLVVLTDYDNVFERMYTNNPVSPLDFFDGSNHGYSTATVLKKDNNSQTLSKTVYQFTNGGSVSDDQSDLYMHTFPRSSMFQYALGCVTDVMDYGNTTSPITETQYNYQQHITTVAITNTSYFDYVWEINAGPAFDHPDTKTRTYDVFDPGISQVIEAKTYNYYNGSPNIEKDVSYTYNDYNDVIAESWVDTRGYSYTKNYTYSIDGAFTGWIPFLPGSSDYTTYISGNADAVAMINSVTPVAELGQNGLDYLITEETTKDLGGYDTTIAFSQTLPNYDPNNPYTVTFNQLAVASLQQPVTSCTDPNNNTTTPGDFHQAYDYVAGQYLVANGPYLLNYNYWFNYNNYISIASQCTKYDVNNNPLEMWADNHQNVSSAFYDLRTNQKIAAVTNAQYNQVAYTSFEDPTNASPGNWSLNTSDISFGSSMTGAYYYVIPNDGSGDITTAVSVNPPPNNYLLTFWCDVAPTVYIGSNVVTPVLITTVGSWNLYTVYGGGNLGTVRITGNQAGGNKIDELRLYPAKSAITSTTYDPLYGPTSECNERNNIIYYNYDIMGRPTITRDINQNIISLTRNTVQGSDN